MDRRQPDEGRANRPYADQQRSQRPPRQQEEDKKDSDDEVPQAVNPRQPDSDDDQI